MAPKVKKMSIPYLLKEIKQNTKLAKEVLKLYGLPNEYKSCTHQSLLEAAIANNNTEIAKLLIEKGCFVSMKTMQKAIDHKNVNLISVILETDKTLLLGKVFEIPPLNYAAKKKAESIVKFLLKKGADWKAVDSMGDSVLHAAAADVEDETYNPKSAINIMKIFLNKKMPVDIENYDGETPLHLAVKIQQQKVVEFLLKQKANLNTCDKKGDSAVHMIIKHNSHSRFDYCGYNYDYESNLDEVQKDREKAEFVDWLIAQGSNVEVENNQGESPLFLAVTYRQKEVIKVLLRTCSKITESDNNNAIFDIFLKAYLKANETASDEIVEMIIKFLQKGAAVNRINKHGDSPIDLVSISNQKRVREIILEYCDKKAVCTEDKEINPQNFVEKECSAMEVGGGDCKSDEVVADTAKTLVNNKIDCTEENKVTSQNSEEKESSTMEVDTDNCKTDKGIIHTAKILITIKMDVSTEDNKVDSQNLEKRM